MIRVITFIKPYSGYILAAWVIAILAVSSTPNLPTLKLHTAKSDIRLDYLIHFCEYAFLAFMTYLAFSSEDFSMKAGRLLIIVAVLVIFATFDEFHQKLIPGRTFNPKDLLSNLTGICTSLLFCHFALSQTK
ncbi:MAG TPA: VanZ family protein [Bacteroidales bacterium]|nr:VanZ family protein [Bacteroidales bacterium]